VGDEFRPGVRTIPGVGKRLSFSVGLMNGGVKSVRSVAVFLFVNGTGRGSESAGLKPGATHATYLVGGTASDIPISGE
jgi:hypothetical protein